MHHPRRNIALIVLMGAAVAGCAADKVTETQFTPKTADTFSYRARASASYPEDSKSAEAQRLQWLGEYLADASLCPAGYEVTKRTPLLEKHALLGDIYDIYYEGRCK